MNSSRPYLLRSLSDWILDNALTPYIVVDASIQGVEVPADFVSNGQIILNISPSAVQGLSIDNDSLHFNARFGGVPMHVYVPIPAVMAIYAKENGQGMVFGAEPGSTPPPPSTTSGSAKEKSEPSKRPSLKVVK